MRLAAVDIGSNTVHALVADVVRGKLEEVAHYVEMPELGAQVAKTGSIGPKTASAIRALRSVVDRARAQGFELLLASATEAVREAKDGAEFAKAAGEAIGVPLHIIAGRREAELSFMGVASRHAVRREWAMVDMGGGSTEIVIARGREIQKAVSLSVGSGVLSSTFLSDPPKPEERARMRKAALRELVNAPDGEVERLVATGGTATNLPLVLAHRNPPPVLTTADLLICEARLDGARASEVAAATGLPANRIKAMRAGIEALLLILDWYGLALLQISHEGLRHGMILSYLEKGQEWYR